MLPWWQRWPGRLENELAWLDYHAISYVRDEKEWAAGRLVLKITHKIGDEEVQLTAKFPATYPETRFEIIAENLALPRHQNPFGKQLCLIGRSSANWNSDDTLAKYILERVPEASAVARMSPADAGEREEQQGEPFTDYYPYVPDNTVFVDSNWTLPPDHTTGLLLLRGYVTQESLTAAVAEIRHGQSVIATGDNRLTQIYPKELHGRWVRWHEPLRLYDPGELLAKLATVYPDVHQRLRHVGKHNPSRVQILGIVFPEEIQHGKVADAWIFIVGFPKGFGLVRASRAGKADLIGRTPELRPAADKAISIVGLGSLGAASALEFARAGVAELNLVDYDFVEAGSVSRWPFGLSAAAAFKVDHLAAYIRKNYPYTDVRAFNGMVGAAIHGDGNTYRDDRDLDTVLQADLIYDATAELGIQQLLSERARQSGRPYACVSTTPGAWGGLVARIVPGRTLGCWTCLQHAINDGEIPPPPYDPKGTIQPVGCASPTFTGAGFDCSTIALSGVRLAISTLARNKEAGYPDPDYDVLVISLRSKTGSAVAPKWDGFPLTRHAKCTNFVTHPANLA